jgi:arsenite methyltransferase
MLARARENQAKSATTDNVEFVEAQITSIPLNAGIADCIISNCVINLVPEADKLAAFNEMARLLKPGGRVAISDILARKELPAELRDNVALYLGCVAGASTQRDYTNYLRQAGFNSE